MDYYSLIKISENDNNKVIPLIKSISDISKINFSPKIVEYVLRENYCKDDIKTLQDLENGYNFILSVGTVTNKDEVDLCVSNNVKILFDYFILE